MALFRQLMAGEFPTVDEWNLAMRMLENIYPLTPGLEVDYSEPGKIGVGRSDDATVADQVTADEQWIGAAASGGGVQITHLAPPVEASPWKSFYVAASSGASPTTLVEVDSRGHIQHVAPDDIPGVANYRYHNCAGGADIILSTDAGAFIKVGTTCYYRDAATTSAPVTDAPSAPGVYASCAACLGSEEGADPCDAVATPDGTATYTVALTHSLLLCPDCGDGGGYDVWDNTLDAVPTYANWWAIDGNGSGGAPRKINDKYIERIEMQLQENYDGNGNCRWRLWFRCGAPEPWVGYKYDGATAAGTYARDSNSCSTGPAFLTVS